MLSSSLSFLTPQEAAAGIEAGRWGVAVSGGADSTALLRLAADRADLSLHVIHLDHQTRGQASTEDAEFVSALADRLCLPVTTIVRDRLEHELPPTLRDALPANPSARYRSLRLALYRRVIEAQQLQGVLLAHHADDQAETVLFRLLRGGGYGALAGIAERANVQGVTLRRPLLCTRRDALREFLGSCDQPWREDTSNAQPDYARNRLRVVLRNQESLVNMLLQVAASCQALAAWVNTQAPELPPAFPTAVLANEPDLLARAAASKWLLARGVAGDDLSSAHVSALLMMCRDKASAARHAAPSNVIIARRQGIVSCQKR